MSEQKPPDPKPHVIVDVQHHHHGERWHSYSFKIDKFPKPLIAYGETREQAEESLHTELRALYGPFNYSIRVTNG